MVFTYQVVQDYVICIMNFRFEKIVWVLKALKWPNMSLMMSSSYLSTGFTEISPEVEEPQVEQSERVWRKELPELNPWPLW